MDIATLTFKQIWHNILPVFTSIGAAYLFFENKRLKKYDAEKEHRIANAALQQLDQNHKKEDATREQKIQEKIVVRLGVTADYRTHAEREADLEEWKEAENKYWNEREKLSAMVIYFENLKNHSLLWFLSKPKSQSVLLKEPNGFRRMIGKIRL